jgi:uncharacterized protein involved in exopolysaccharide biosynthesis
MDVAMNERQIVSLRPYVDVLYRHRLSFACILAVGLGLTTCALFMLPRAYRSSVLLVEKPPEVVPGYVTEPRPIDTRERIRLLSDSALNHRQLTAIIRSFNLYPRRRAAHQSIDELAYRMRHRIAFKPAVGILRSGQMSSAFELSFEYPVAALAQAVTARLSKILVEADHTRRVAAAAAAERFIHDQVTAARAALEAKSAKVEAFEERHAGALPYEMTSNLQQLDGLQAQLRSASEALARGPAASRWARLERLETRLDMMRARYNSAYPDVVVLRAEIDALKKQTAGGRTHSSAATMDGVALPSGGGTYAYDRLQLQRVRLLRQIADVRKRIAETPANEQALDAIERDDDVLANNYARLMRLLLAAKAAVLLERRDEGRRLVVVDSADLPLQPTRPNRAAILALGAILSLGAAIALPFALFFTDSSFRNPEELSQEHASPVLIAIPELKKMREHRARLRNGIGAGAAAFIAFSIGATALWMYAIRLF